MTAPRIDTEAWVVEEEVMSNGENAALPEWSMVDTHCVRCLRPMATMADDKRHDDEYGERFCDERSCWCLDLCWEANFSGDCPGDPSLPVHDDLALLLIIRGLLEERAARSGSSPKEGR